MKPFPHSVDPSSIDVRRSYTITEAADLIGLSRSRMKHYAMTGELRTEPRAAGDPYLVKGTNFRLFYVNRAGKYWPHLVTGGSFRNTKRPQI